MQQIHVDYKLPDMGLLGGLVFRPLPSAHVMISGSWDGAQHRALCSVGSLHSPLLCLSLYLLVICQMGK